MKDKTLFWIRSILAAIIIIFIHKQAGIATAVSIILIGIALELISAWMDSVNDLLKQLVKHNNDTKGGDEK
tara:strand:- start:213 stop:425 length:213 start_codon:yes stop_codon:yes gene_type:complete